MIRRSPGYRLPTRADVASYAGVSEAVVSFVVNGGPRPVAAQTAERVRAAIEVLGYRPNLSARVATRAAGLPDGPRIRVPFSRDGGYRSGRQLLDTVSPPDAIVASSDLQAVGVLRAAYELGVKVPADVALVGFDGTQEAEFCCPTPTVSRQPLRDRAADAVNTVLARAPGPPSHQTYPMELIIGQSCGCSGNQGHESSTNREGHQWGTI